MLLGKVEKRLEDRSRESEAGPA